jgi:hypothetical protein
LFVIYIFADCDFFNVLFKFIFRVIILLEAARPAGLGEGRRACPIASIFARRRFGCSVVGPAIAWLTEVIPKSKLLISIY